MPGFVEWASKRGLESLALDSAEDRARLADLVSTWLERASIYSDQLVYLRHLQASESLSLLK